MLLLADAVLDGSGETIDYRGALPLAGFSEFEGQAETRDGWITVDARRLARVLPMGLPEWRVERCRGELQARDAGLELTQSLTSKRLFAPLFLDLQAARFRRDCTWRQLTVAEDRRIVGSDEAVGYRAQCGADQWVVYRSLDEPAVRSVLGKNLRHELLFGAFPPSGKIKTLLEIEEPE